MHKLDEDKTTFITDKVMLFGLKNSGETFQHLVDQVFLHQIGRNISSYVDDILVKSKNINGHHDDSKETFDMFKQ